MQHDIYIITPDRTGSTLLANTVYGLFLPGEPVTFIKADFVKPVEPRNSKIYKTHHMVYYEFDDVYNIGVERPEINKRIDARYKYKPNSLIFTYRDLVYQSNYSPNATGTVSDTVQLVADKISSTFDISINQEQINNSIKRIENMNARYEEIKNEPFNVVDKFYHIRGGHRNRGKQEL